ncbi:ATP-binding protein [Glycomyces luteolus]|uniref:ATP-binding protein n=1 Tax=Glycomyces luteolus TaxID=2670330 RepID=A0A9X3SR47_9ACTN|nr:ATP-binding protein [Glycomyces luteolus]MDA1358138.1 ATP-binding protein [Glycomyces luteolus]
MRPEVWGPVIATLAAPLVPMVIALIANSFKNEPHAESNAPASGTVRVRRAAALAAIPAAIAVFTAPRPWNWIAAGAYVLALTSVLTWVWLRSKRHPRVLPDAARLLETATRPTPGFEYDRDFLPDLVRVYTRNDLARERDSLELSNSEKPQEAATEQRLSFDKVIADPKVRHIAITGEAGVGKTFLLRYWEHELRHRTASSDRATKFKPLLVAARRLVGCASIAEAFGETDTDALARPPGKGLTWLVMIDAFDEITSADDRNQVEHLVFEAVEDATKHSRACKFVLTTRGLTDDRRRSFESRGVTEFELRPFTSEQLHAFLVNAETSIPDREHQTAAYRAAVAKADRFLKRWEDEDDLLELIKLPLLARVAATIYFQDRHLELPSRRVDIYHDAIEHWIAQFHKRMSVDREQHGLALRLLHEWQGAAGETGPDSTDIAIRDLLRRLASQYLESGQRPVVGIACDLLRLQVRPKEPRELDALVTLLEATGLVHDVRTAHSHFVHKSYAEYLAAPDALASYQTPKDWEDAFRDPERRISAIFAFAQIPHDQRAALIETMRGGAECVHALGWIAAEGLCVVQGTGRIDHETRNSLIEAVLQVWPPYPKPDWWRLVNGLCNVKHARDLLFRFVEEGRQSESDRVSVSGSLANHDPRGVGLLREFASEGHDPWIRWNAANELLDHDRASARDILNRLAADRNTPDNCRLAALRALVGHWPKSTMPSLLELAEDPNASPFDRVNAAYALIEHSPTFAEGLLSRFIEKRGFQDLVRVNAATWLCEIDQDTGTAALQAFASKREVDAYARGNAASGLSHYDRETGVAILWDLVRDRAIPNRARIMQLVRLRELDPEPAARELAAVSNDRSLDAIERMIIARIPAQYGATVDVATLESIASDPSVSDGDQVYAIDEMVSVDQVRMLDRLRRYATDPGTDGHARVQAATYLQQYDYRTGTSLLEAIADDEAVSDLVRENALASLMRTGHPTARQRLLDLAMDESVPGPARLEAVRSLMPRLGEQGLTILREMQSENRLQPEDRADVVVSLAEFDEREPTDRLAELANDPEAHEDARIKAAAALVRYHPSDATEALYRVAVSGDVSDHARYSAARELLRGDPESVIPLLSELAADLDARDGARVNAAKTVAEVDCERGRSLLLPLAQDAGLYRSLPVDAAYWLYKFGDDRGKTLVAGYATGSQLDDQARVEAARRLLELDRERGVALLTEFSSDYKLDGRAQTEAALHLARIDREAGLRELQKIADWPPALGSRAAHGARGIAKYRPQDGSRLLHNLASDEDIQGTTRVIAADGMAEYGWKSGVQVLRDLAENGSLDPYSRELAARRLSAYDCQAAGEILQELLSDDSVPAAIRAEAADDLPVGKFRLYLELQRCFADDPTFDGIGRIAAALSISFEKKREGQDRLRALAIDPALDETERCWAEINLSLRDVEVRTSLERRVFDPGTVDFERLRAAADEQIRLDLRAGHQCRRQVEALASLAGTRLISE